MAHAGWKSFVVRHLYTYLALLCGLVVVVGILLGRDALGQALESLRWPWMAAALLLTLSNYGLRFTKWDRMLRDCGIRISRGANARLYFACLAMVVTPGRLGELYKLVFLRRLHHVPPTRSLAPLVMERVTDALAVLVLTLPYFFPTAQWAWVAVALSTLLLTALGRAVSHPAGMRLIAGIAGRTPGLRSRREALLEALEHHRVLLRGRAFGPALVLSLLGWWAECLGLWCILRGLGVEVALHDATWVYAASTLLGNLTFLPGGLGSTEVSLVALLTRVGVESGVGIGATALVRAATLWFAVLLGLATSLSFRRALQWDEVRAEAADRSQAEV